LEDKVATQKKEVQAAGRKLCALTGSNGGSETLDVYVEESVQNFGHDKPIFCIKHLRKADGYYYLVLEKHAVGLYYNEESECRLFDANTGEWVLQNEQSFQQFFEKYFSVDVIYNQKQIQSFDDKTYRLYGYVKASPPAAHKAARPCPFPVCPFSGFLTLACRFDETK